MSTDEESWFDLWLHQELFLQDVQTGCEAHPVSHLVHTEDFSTVSWSGWSVIQTPHHHRVLRSRISIAVPPLCYVPSRCAQGNSNNNKNNNWVKAHLNWKIKRPVKWKVKPEGILRVEREIINMIECWSLYAEEEVTLFQVLIFCMPKKIHKKKKWPWKGRLFLVLSGRCKQLWSFPLPCFCIMYTIF